MGAAPGLASGVNVPEEAAIFLAVDLEEARWFAGMSRGHPVDIWEVHADRLDLFVTVEGWVYCPAAISPDRLRLIATDLELSRAEDG
jgi:hypothetical protein